MRKEDILLHEDTRCATCIYLGDDAFNGEAGCQRFPPIRHEDIALYPPIGDVEDNWCGEYKRSQNASIEYSLPNEEEE